MTRFHSAARIEGASSLFRALAALAALAAAPAKAQGVADVFRGQTLRVVIPSAPGGARVLYTLPVVEFIGRHLPGKPNVQPVFMPGAGGSLAINYAYNAARDGLTIVTPLVAAATSQAVADESVKYDLTRMHWIGRTADATRVLFVWHTVPASSVADLRGRELIIGSAGRASDTFTNPALMNRFLGAKFKIVVGYKSAVDVNQAVENRETDAATTTWSDLVNLRADWVRDKKIRVLAQIGLSKLDDLPGTPLLDDLAANDDDRRTLEFMSSSSEIGEGFVAPPDTPRPVVEALRRGFDETMRDPDFLAAARKLNLSINPRTGEEMTAISNAIVNAPRAVVDRYLAALAAN